jgi:ABC-type glycerol-3-phosphate transport system permease component
MFSRCEKESELAKKTALRNSVIYAVVMLLILICGVPFLWMASSSLKTIQELHSIPPVWFPRMPSLINYQKVVLGSNIPRYFLNSMVVSTGSTSIALLIAMLASYGFARFEFRGKLAFQSFVLASCSRSLQ